MAIRARATPSAFAEEVLGRLDAEVGHQERQADLQARVKRYEERYGIESHRVHDAIERGLLQETQEVCRWLIAYDLLQRAASR